MDSSEEAACVDGHCLAGDRCDMDEACIDKVSIIYMYISRVNWLIGVLYFLLLHYNKRVSSIQKH